MQLYLSQLYLSIEQHERVSADKAGNYFAAGFLLSSLLLLWAAAAKTYKRKGYCIFRCKREKWTQLGGYHLRRAYKSGVTSTKGAQGLMINTKFYPICRVRESMWSKITKALRYIFPENWQKQSPI